MKCLQRIRWLSLAAVLLGIGYGTHRLLPRAPRWSMTGNYASMFSKDGTRVITWQVDGEVRGPIEVWDVATQQLLASYLDDGSPWRHIFAAREQDLMVACRPERWHVIDLDKGAERTLHLAAPLEFNNMSVSPCGNYARVFHAPPLTGVKLLQDRTFFFYDLHSGARVADFDRAIWSRFIANSQSVLVGTSDTVGIYNLAREAFEQKFPVQWHTVHASGDGRCVAAPTGVGQVTLWGSGQAHTRELRLTPRLPGDQLSMRFSPDKRWLVTYPFGSPVNLESLLEVWEVATGQRVGSHRLVEQWPWLEFSPDSSALALRAQTGADALTLLDLPSGKPRWQRAWNAVSQGADLSTVRFSPDGKSVLPFGDGCATLLWLDIDTGEVSRNVTLSTPFEISFASQNPTVILLRPRAPAGHQSALRKWLDGWLPQQIGGEPLIFVDANTGNERLRIRRHTDRGHVPTELAPDGMTLMTRSPVIGPSALIEIWDLPSAPRWGWIIGVPLGIVTVFAMSRIAIARRHRSTSASL